MTPRDGFPRFSARSAWRGDAGHREPCATPPESLGKPPSRSRGRTARRRREALPTRRVAGGPPPTRRIARAISRGQYYGPLVLSDGSPPPESFGAPRGRGCPVERGSTEIRIGFIRSPASGLERRLSGVKSRDKARARGLGEAASGWIGEFSVRRGPAARRFQPRRLQAPRAPALSCIAIRDHSPRHFSLPRKGRRPARASCFSRLARHSLASRPAHWRYHQCAT